MWRSTVKTGPVTVKMVRNPSDDPSLEERTLRMAGPSQKDPAFITSRWRIGWQTPTLMIACYLFAAFNAILHLLLFRYLDGKEADGPNRAAPQSYVTTASNIIANVFGFSLRASMAVAFVQYLWHLLRVSTMKVSTIELLFTIRTNLFMLLRASVLRATPTLCLLALYIWVLQVIPSFPPGAITVTTAQKTTFDMVTVPTYNASFMGNASGLEANLYSLANLVISESGGGFSATGTQGTKHRSLLSRVAFPVLVKGEAFTTPSPCGVNCSYVIEFEGPYLKCANSTSTFAHKSQSLPIYTGRWVDKRDTFLTRDGAYNGTYSDSSFNSTTLTPLVQNTTDGSLFLKQDDLFCLPGRAKFTVNITYTNNVKTQAVTSKPIDRLLNLHPDTHSNMVVVPEFSATSGAYGFGTAPANWSTYAQAFYRDVNHMTIIGGMMFYLQGIIHASSVVPEDLAYLDGGTVPTQDGDYKKYNSTLSYDVVWGQREYLNASSGECLSVNDSMIDTTRFNMNFGHFKASEPANMVFNITEKTLNDQLFNMTTSMMAAFGTWNTTTNATILDTVNVYQFSEPLILILPYFISLALSIPFLILGGVALVKNGVSAIDSSFMQILSTSTGSAALHKAAAGGCLGGDESMSQELKDLKIRFGEIIDREEPGKIRRAAFGVEGEVTSLNKSANYGIARWI